MLDSQANFLKKIPDGWKEILADIWLSRIITISKNTTDYQHFRLKYG